MRKKQSDTFQELNTKEGKTERNEGKRNKKFRKKTAK